MAESTLSITYTDIRYQVARYLGWPTDHNEWSTEQTNDFEQIVSAGLRAFYFPAITKDEPLHEWSFLRKYSSISLAAGDTAYDLPDNFACIIPDSVYIPNRRLSKISVSEILTKLTVNSQQSSPVYFAVRAKDHSPTSGQRWELLVYPSPQESSTLSYAYAHVPDTIDDTNLYPVGGANYSHVILLAILAAAENLLDDDPSGPQSQAFAIQLQAAIRADKSLRSVSPETTAQGATA